MEEAALKPSWHITGLGIPTDSSLYLPGSRQVLGYKATSTKAPQRPLGPFRPVNYLLTAHNKIHTEAERDMSYKPLPY